MGYGRKKSFMTSAGASTDRFLMPDWFLIRAGTYTARRIGVVRLKDAEVLAGYKAAVSCSS